MPYDSGTGVFTRIWKFVDQFLAGDDALRASFDTALDDIADGVNDGLDDIRADLADLEASRGLYLGLDDALPTTNTEGGALVDGNSVIVGGLHYYWETDAWNPVGIDGAEALGLILLGLENTPEGRAAGRTALGLGSTALLDWNPADITGSMRARDNVVIGWGTGTGPAPGTEPITSDFVIRHDGANTFMQVLGTGNLFIDSDTVTFRSKDGLKTGLTVAPGGAVTLRHNNLAWLSTTATGVQIEGIVTGGAIATTGEAQGGATAGKLIDTVNFRSALGPANAALTVGAVGTYALLQQTTLSTARSPGATLAGSSLLYTSAGPFPSASVSPAGTWRLMGAIASATSEDRNTSLWLRIS